MDAWGLIMSAMANLSLAVLLLIKERRRTPQDSPPAVTCPQHSGLVARIKEIRQAVQAAGEKTNTAIDQLAEKVNELAVSLARLEGRRHE